MPRGRVGRGSVPAQEDPAVAKLRKELKEIGFDEQVIQAVLLLESGGAIPSLEQAIDLCLGHAEFQVVERSSPDKSTSAGQADKATSALPAAAEVPAEAVTKIDPPNEAQHQHTANISCHQDNAEPPASVSTPQREHLPPPQHLPGNGEGIGMSPAALGAGSGAIPALSTTMSPRGVPAPLHHPIGAAGGGGAGMMDMRQRYMLIRQRVEILQQQMMHLQLMWSQQGGGAPPPPALRMQLFQMDQQRLALLAMLPLPWGPDNGGASDGGLLPSSVASGMPKGSSSDWPGEAVWSMGFGGNRNGWGESNGTPMDSALSQQKETNPPSSAQQPHSASPEDAFYSSIRTKNASADEEQAVLAPAVASLFAAHHASISPGPPAGGGSVSGEVSASERPEEYPTQERLRALQLERRQAEQQAEAATPTKEVCAVLCGYLGSRFHGLQKHEKGPPTVEEELESALIKAGALVYNDDVRIFTNHLGLKNGDLSACRWTHASRTDKGVHAVGQCIALTCHLQPFGNTWEQQQLTLVRRLNECLAQQAKEKRPPLPSPDVVVYAVKKAPKGFYDDRRIDRSRGMGGITPFDARRDATGRLYEYQCPSAALVPFGRQGVGYPAALRAVRVSRDDLDKVQSVLRLFEGIHDFHNFTADKCSDEGPCETQRLVTRFTCAGTRVSPVSGIEYVALHVQGDSFIYHQIRKMVGLAIYALHYIPDETRLDWMKRVLDNRQQCFVPLAPSLGLMLERVLFQKENKTHGCHTVLIDFEDVSGAMQQFKERRIYPEIDEREKEQQKIQDGSMQVHSCAQHWLNFLHRTRAVWGRTFDAFGGAVQSSDLEFLFQQRPGAGAGVGDKALLKLLPVMCECVALVGGSMPFFPDFVEVLMERLRSRRALSKEQRTKLRKSLSSLPPASAAPGGRTLRLEARDGSADVVMLEVDAEKAAARGLAGGTELPANGSPHGPGRGRGGGGGKERNGARKENPGKSESRIAEARNSATL